jgi:hypothetical protein
MRYNIVLIFFATLLFSCGQTDTKQKELELKEKELNLKERELSLKEKSSQTDTSKEQAKPPVSNPIKDTSNKAISKTNFSLTKFAGSWLGEENDAILIKVNGNSIVGYSDYDNNKEINFKGTAIDDNTFETSNYGGQPKSMKSIWHLNNKEITVTTNGKKVYSFSKL